MADIRPIKSELTKLIVTIQKLNDQHIATSPQNNIKRRRRNGHGLPLSAWMLGTRNEERSKIIAVTENRARYPYQTLGGAIYVIADRAMKGKQLTAIQRHDVLLYVARRYRGRPTEHLSNYWCQESAIDKDVPLGTQHETRDWLRQIPGMPLSMLLSEHLTNGLIAAHLYFTLLNRGLKWKQRNF